MDIGSIIAIAVGAFLLFIVVRFFVTHYKRCPSDKLLVIYGLINGEHTAKYLHSGGSFVWPILQDYEYLDLTPMTVRLSLTGDLAEQKIRINVPSSFTFRISEKEGLRDNATIVLLGLSTNEIKEMAQEIILSQLQSIVASLTIEEINRDHISFQEKIRRNVEAELNRIGLTLLNMKTDIY